ncbi:CoA-binding protein [Natronolimnohabitans innermongolicus]|uniref:acetate--CoA ligase (ADP-forming) n=1 Tax=Natronolimnohabitans innermongolicus JCM 12255 TaxID=1227499 RepID=L9WRM0_9EURY|nr:CoA-binding protein [Natronolimnohabitans innermongolicus]ELY50958.1 CoA-binding protein [Natronolimnohabitans innermongolicus JCM 12255]
MGVTDLFDPDGIAVIGASKTPGKLGNDAMTNIRTYDGDVYPVNPSSEGEVYGYEFVDSVSETDADLALCCVPSPVVPEVLEECGEAGVGAAVIFAGGFAEVDEAGEQREEEIIRIGEEYDMTILGPNTAGYCIPDSDLYGSFVPQIREVETGNVALVAQSGGVGITSAFQFDREEYGVSAMFGLGNRANTDFAELIPLLDDDPQTEAIAIHIEGTDDIENTLAVCREAETPIVAYKAGSENLSEFLESHTGAPIQDRATYEDALAGEGVVFVDSVTELIDSARAIADTPTPDGNNVGVVTAQAGPGIIIADELDKRGAEFPDLEDETQERVDGVLQDITYTENPVDTGRPLPEFGQVVDAVARDENIDIVVVYEIYEDSLGYPVEELETLAEEVDKPILFTVAGPDSFEEERLQMEAAGIPTFQAPERGAHAVGALIDSVADE